MPEMLTDQALLEREQTGLLDAFTELYSRHADRVFGHCARRILDRSDAEDLVGEVFAIAWRSQSSLRYDDTGSALPWLLSIANNLLKRHHRSRAIHARAIRKLAAVDSIADPAVGLVDDLEDRRNLALLAQVLAELRPRDRDVIQMCVVEGLTPNAVARATGQNAATVRSHLHRALKRARVIFQRMSIAAGNPAATKVVDLHESII